MSQAWDRGTGQQKEAAAPSGCDVEDPIEETPGPLQERLEPASQERAVPDRRSPPRQRKQLKRMFADEQVPPGVHNKCSLKHPYSSCMPAFACRIACRTLYFHPKESAVLLPSVVRICRLHTVDVHIHLNLYS